MNEKERARVELQLHTIMSDEVSLITPVSLIKEAGPYGMKAIAITDRDSVQSFHEIAYYQELYGSNLKIIYGAELLVADDIRATILVKDQEGLKSIYKMISGQKLTPQEREHLLIGAHEPSLLSDLIKLAQDNDDEKLLQLLEGYDYIELITEDNHASYRQQNQQIYEIGKMLDKPVVAVGNCHYIHPQQYIGKKVLDTVKYNKVNREDLYLRTTEELLEQYAYLGEDAAYEVVVTNPNKIADSIQRVEPRQSKHAEVLLKDAKIQVIQTCRQRVEELYGMQPHVSNRLNDELALLDDKTSSLFWIYHNIAKHIQDKGGFYGVSGAAGSTLIAYLLEISDTNPLPAHHRCPECKHIEFVEEVSGFDIPMKICPHCGSHMVGDGHNIPYETCLGVHGDVGLDIGLKTSNAMKLEAIQFLKEYFGSERLAAVTEIDGYDIHLAKAYIEVYSDLTGDEVDVNDQEWIAKLISNVKKEERLDPGGIMLLPEGIEWEDITPIRPNDDELMFATHCDCCSIYKMIPNLDVLTSVDYERLQALFVATGTKPEDIDYQDSMVYAVFCNHDTSSIPDFPYEFIIGPLYRFDAVSFSDLIKVSGMAHGSIVWNDNGEHLIKEHSFKELISDRDDVFLTLQKYGIDRETAYRIMVETRKGKLPWKGKYKWKSPHIKEMIEILEQSDVPGWYVESMRKVHFLPPKAYVTHYAKMAVAFAWFQVYYPEEYRKCVLE